MRPFAFSALLRLSRTALPWLAAVLAPSLFASPAYVTIGTGALNGVYYPTGGAICRLLNEESARHGLHCTVQSTSGSIANLAALAKGEVQLALMQSDVLYHAVHGSGPFAGQAPDDQLRSLLRLHKESLTLIASATSNITALADIKGKRVDVGAPNSGDRVTSRALLDAMGWRIADFSRPPVISPGNRLEGLCDGTLDAAFVVAGHPNQAIGDLTGRCQARLIPIEGEQVDKLLKQHPYYDRSRIAANLYPGQTSGVNTFAVTAELVALASLPESEVRTLRDVLNERLKQFTRLHPALTTLTWEGMQAGSIALLHPHPPGGHPHGIRCRGDLGCPANLAPGEQRGHTDRWGRPPGRHRATGGVRHLAGAAGRRDPLNQFGGGLHQPGPGPDRAAHTGQRNPGTRPSPDPA